MVHSPHWIGHEIDVRIGFYGYFMSIDFLQNREMEKKIFALYLSDVVASERLSEGNGIEANK